LSTSAAKNAGLIDDLTHRTPHYGYTSEITDQQGDVHAHVPKIKDSSSVSQFKQVGHNSHSKESHSRASRDEVSSSARKKEAVR
jgi:hypothetical protein